MKTCIIIPCYNEEERIQTKDFLEFISNNNIDFCFVNDGSKDDTINVLHTIKRKEKEKVLILNLDKNKGKAEAIRIAILDLYNKHNYDLIGYLDADLATPLFEIKNLQREFLENNKLLLVMGSRFKRLGAKIDRNFGRFFFGRIFATLISSFVLKIPVYDTQCGAKLFSTNIPKNIFEQKFITKWFFDVEILLRLKKHYKSNFLNLILEYPLKVWEEKGESKLKFSDFLATPIEIIKIKIKYK